MKSFFRDKVDEDKHIITVNKIKPKKGVDLNYILTIIAAEESTGTESVFLKNEVKYYTPKFETEKIRERFGGKITKVKQDGEFYMVDIAYPLENICQQPPNMPMLLTTIIGDHNGLPEVESCRLEDVHFPYDFLKDYKGPQFGIPGIRKILDEPVRPLIGAIIKPNIGNTPQEPAKMCGEMAEEGIDFIKDDELLVDVECCRLKDRAELVMKGLGDVYRKKGKKTLYSVNITAPQNQMLKNAYTALFEEANCLMINFLATGCDALRKISETVDVPIHTHRCGHDTFTRDLDRGVAMRVFAKLARINGADFVHIGNVGGKTPEQIKDIQNTYKALTNYMGHIKPSFPVSSRVVAGEMKYLLDSLGTDLVMLGCAGIHRHPMGRRAGVKSFVDARDYYFGEKKSISEEFKRATEI